jgi:hypothetical protein
MPSGRHSNPALRGRAGGLRGMVLRVLAAAGLAVNAWVHANIADEYDAVVESISQGALFRIEAGLASLAALLVLIWRRFPALALAWLVAAGGLALLLIYRWVDVGQAGPFPDMYEPVWSSDKTITVIAQGVTILATTSLMLARRRAARTM